jgi:hypothetical protein
VRFCIAVIHFKTRGAQREAEEEERKRGKEETKKRHRRNEKTQRKSAKGKPKQSRIKRQRKGLPVLKSKHNNQ